MTSRSSLQPEPPGDVDAKGGVVALPIDPYRVHVYWRIERSGFQQDAPATEGGTSGTVPVLRFHRIAPAPSELEEFGAFFEVAVELDAPNWYVHLPQPSGRYLVELGLRTDDGRFTVLARSPLVQTPPVAPSENDEEVTMLVMGDLVLPNPFPEDQEAEPAEERPLPPPAAASRADDRSAPDSAIRPFPLPPPPQGIPLMNLGIERILGLARTEADPESRTTAPGKDRERRLVEWNEETFAGGQSSIVLGDRR